MLKTIKLVNKSILTPMKNFQSKQKFATSSVKCVVETTVSVFMYHKGINKMEYCK